MRIVTLGRAEDVRGFRLAGVEAVTCETPREADALVANLGLAEAHVGLLMVPAWVERAIPSALARLRVRDGPPIVVVLPEEG